MKVAGKSYGDIGAGATSKYQDIELRFRYAALELTVDGRKVTGQTLNFGSKRITYKIDIVDLEEGHLAMEVIRE